VRAETATTCERTSRDVLHAVRERFAGGYSITPPVS
jgi:hypothetical protein